MKSYIQSILFSIFFTLTIFGLAIGTNAQVGANNLFCPSVPNTDGMINLQITALGPDPATFSAGMIGTFQSISGNTSGGLDWMTTRGTSPSTTTLSPTNEMGSQLVTWWTRKDGRNTQIQVTNHAENLEPGGLDIHVHIYASDCTEIRDFCDTFTPSDTHVYDLSNLTTNTGADIAESNLANREGILIVTPVNDCTPIRPSEELAIEHNYLTGNVMISDPLGFTYGSNMYARRAICIEPDCTGELTGSNKARFDSALPDVLYGLFNTVSSNSGSDAVVMNFVDDYGPPYLPRMPSSRYNVSIFDNNENEQSCGETEACFLRLGIDSSLPARQDYTGP